MFFNCLDMHLRIFSLILVELSLFADWLLKSGYLALENCGH